MQTNQELTEDLLVSWSARERLTEEVLSPGPLTEQLRQSPHVRAGLPMLNIPQREAGQPAAARVLSFRPGLVHDDDDVDDDTYSGGDGGGGCRAPIEGTARDHFYLGLSHLGEAVRRMCGGGGGGVEGGIGGGKGGGGGGGVMLPPPPPPSRVSPEEKRPPNGHDFPSEGEKVSDGEIEPSERCLIRPDASWKEKWDLFILALILYSAIVVPFRICFQAEAEGLVWDVEVGISLAFMLDMVLTFNTAYRVDERWVVSRRKIASRYFQGWFWIDFPSSLPVELIEIFLDDMEGLGLLRFLRLFRLLRLLKLLKVDEVIGQVEERYELNLKSLRILQMVLKLLFLSHMLGCFFYYTASMTRETYEANWVDAYGDHDSVVEEEKMRLYLHSLYWALTTLTTVGYGDITPTNDVERLFCLGALLIGGLVFGFIVSTIGSMVAAIDRQAGIIDEKMDAVKEYMLHRRIPRPIAKRVRIYYEHYFASKSAYDESQILGGMPPALRFEVATVIVRDTIGSMPIFQPLGSDVQMEAFLLLKPISTVPLEWLYRRGERSRELFFLLKGTVDVLDASEERVLFQLHESAYFGETAISGRRREASIISRSHCELYSLARDDLQVLFAKFPELSAKMDAHISVELKRKDRIYKYSYRFLINAIPKEGPQSDPSRRSALIVQLAWFNFTCMQWNKKSVFTAPSEPAPPDHGVVGQTDILANNALLLKMSSQIEMLTRMVQSQSEAAKVSLAPLLG
jgi:hypothetical protein